MNINPLNTNNLRPQNIFERGKAEGKLFKGKLVSASANAASPDGSAELSVSVSDASKALLRRLEEERKCTERGVTLLVTC